MRFFARTVTFVLLSLLAAPVAAQNREVPYWASMRSEEVNMRVGPSEEYRIDWVYRRAQLPVKVIRVMEGWRLIRDADGAQGWVVARLLSPERTVMVVGKGLASMRDGPGESSALRWNVEPGVVGKLGKCEADWCELAVGKRKGWVRQQRLWGAGEP